MHSEQSTRRCGKFIVRWIGAILYCIAAAPYAADLTLSMYNPEVQVREPQAKSAGNLRLQLAQSLTKPRDKQNASLDSLKLAWTEDDCEENIPGNLPLGKASRNSGRKGQLSASLDGTMLAKLDRNAKPSSRRTSDVAMHDELFAAASPTPAGGRSSSTGVPSSAAGQGMAAKPASAWEILPSDITLNTSLMRWASAAGWQLIWELPVDYAVEARTSISGSFEEAVTVVARSMESAEIPMKAIFYKGNNVLRIVAKGDQ
jgi:hypothetical protein